MCQETVRITHHTNLLNRFAIIVINSLKDVHIATKNAYITLRSTPLHN